MMGTPLRSQRYFNVVPLAHPDLLAFRVDPTRVLPVRSQRFTRVDVSGSVPALC